MFTPFAKGQGAKRHLTPVQQPRKRVSAVVPILKLEERHRQRILKHLLSLDKKDRYLRFGYHAHDEQIRQYVERIDFANDVVLGIFNRRLELVALAHLAFFADPERKAEFGVSVLPKVRGQGLGSRLFKRSALFARNRNASTMVIHALNENAAMLRIARKAGAEVVTDDLESAAYLRLPNPNAYSLRDENVQNQWAAANYRLKKMLHQPKIATTYDKLS